MKDGYLLKAVAMGAIALCYAAYLCFTPDPADGVLFGTVCGTVALLAGIDIGRKAAAG